MEELPFSISKPIESSMMLSTRDEPEPGLLHRSLLERPLNVESASGIYLNLRDGRQIMDACGGAAVAIIGHGNEEVIKAAMKQMMKVSYVHTLSYTTDAAENLANLLLEGNTCEEINSFVMKVESKANIFLNRWTRKSLFRWFRLRSK
jgi:4-aminobutyrate aminotransferase-like enzyme